MLSSGEPGRWIGADSEMTAAEAPTANPGIDAIGSRWAQKGCIICSICSSSLAIISSSWSR